MLNCLSDDRNVNPPNNGEPACELELNNIVLALPVVRRARERGNAGELLWMGIKSKYSNGFNKSSSVNYIFIKNKFN